MTWARNAAPRDRLAFRAVNRPGDAGYDPGMQRHHLLPRELLTRRCFGALFDRIGGAAIGYDDFRANGLLLPSSDPAALRIGLPLHRGPHRRYNAIVIARVGPIEESWSRARLSAPAMANAEAVMRLRLLQAALRRRLLDRASRPLALTRRRLVPSRADFAELDAMADALWGDLASDSKISAPPSMDEAFVTAE